MTADALGRVLVVDDEAAQTQALCDTLRDQGYDTAGFTRPEEALEALQQEQFDVLLTDLEMPGMTGVQLLTSAQQVDPQLVGILMTGRGTIETAVKAMQSGALDYILKPFKIGVLLPVIARAAGVRRLRMENLELRNTVALHELNQAIAHTFDSTELLDKIVAAAIAQFDGDEASVMLLSEDHRYLEVAAAHGCGRDNLFGTRIPVGEGIAGKVAERREPLVQEGEVKDPHALSLQPRADIKTSLSMPMMAGSRLIGVLNINCTRMRQSFLLGQVKMLGVFTNAAASGIEAARLYEAQRKADARYREVLQMAADGVISLDEQRRIVIFNSAAERLFGYSAAEILGKPLDLLLPAEAIEEHRCNEQGDGSGNVHASTMSVRAHLPGRRKDGTVFNAEVGISQRLENGNVLYTAVVRDITRRVQQEEKIARLSRTRAVLSGINSAIVRIRDRDQLFRETCRIAVEEGGFRLAWIGLAEPGQGKVKPVAWMGADEGYLDDVGIKLRDLEVDPGAGGRALREKQAVIIDEIETSPRVVFRREALARDYRSFVVMPLIVGDAAAGVIAFYSAEPNSFDPDEMKLITELAADLAFALQAMEKEDQLYYRSHHDVLTDLPNRARFSELVDQRVGVSSNAHKRFGVILLDVEHFRNVNETLGRQSGDAVLRELARRLLETVGHTGLLARVGADQYAFATQRAARDEAHLARMLQRILAVAVGSPFEIGEGKLQLSARAGIAVYPADGIDAETLCRNAEAALRDAKRTSQPYQFYASRMNAATAQTLRLESRLRGALQRSEFVLHYQPKVDLRTGGIAGLEALIRWRDPETGLVSPMQFIPILEETGLIIEVGSWVMLEAVRTAKALRAKGLPPLRIAVNVSPVQLQQEGFVNTIKDAISIAGDEPHGLDLEITESAIMHDIEANVVKLEVVRKLGIELAIDDFGTGYSSLAYISRLPVGTIKIDRAFIRNVKEDANCTTIVQTIISLTHALSRKVVAEGVETEEQAELLRMLHCDQYQGYLFSKPVPLNELESLLRRQPASL
jgi:diguanylate cyclase (GGDEF)-like protein/PAS domain S-box-containing protein